MDELWADGNIHFTFTHYPAFLCSKSNIYQKMSTVCNILLNLVYKLMGKGRYDEKQFEN